MSTDEEPLILPPKSVRAQKATDELQFQRRRSEECALTRFCWKEPYVCTIRAPYIAAKKCKSAAQKAIDRLQFQRRRSGECPRMRS